MDDRTINAPCLATLVPVTEVELRPDHVEELSDSKNAGLKARMDAIQEKFQATLYACQRGKA